MPTFSLSGGGGAIAARPIAAGLLLAAAAVSALTWDRAEVDVSPALGTGYRDGILVGLELEIPGVRPENAVWRVGGNAQIQDSQLRLVTTLLETNCQNEPGLPCIEPEQAIVRFFASTLLDYRHLIPLDGRPTGMHVLRGNGRQERVFSLDMPELAPGRHCLVVAAFEDPLEVTGRQLAAHSNVGVFSIIVDEPTPNHCRAPPWRALRRTEPNPQASFGCGAPLISRSDRVPTGVGQVEAGTQLWLHIPQCGGRVVVILARDGALLGEGTPISPFSVETTEPPDPHLVRALPALPRGGWYTVAILDALEPSPSYTFLPMMVT